MGYFAGAHDLRKLLAVAGTLRAFARDNVAPRDRNLYLTAAAALEARANWMASTLPDSQPEPPLAFSHRPVDMRV